MVNPLPTNHNCPECGTPQDDLIKALHQEGEAYIQAEVMIKSCKGCMRRLGHHLTENRVEVLTVDEFLKLDKIPEGKIIDLR